MTARHTWTTAVLGALLVTAAPAGQTSLRAGLVGHWRLVGVDQHRDGQPVTQSLGPAPVGMLSYTADGHVLAHLTPATRPKVRAAEATADDLRALARYTAYFGTFDVDETARTVTHHRDGSFAPGERDLVRQVSLDGTRLVLTTPPTVVNGERRHSTITWERLPAAAVDSGYQAAARQAVAGTWALVDHRTILATGEVRHAFGPTPRGLFVFHADGHTSVQIADAARPETPLDRATPDDLRAFARSYLAYFGRYDVDPATRKIVVHTTADLNPLNTGVDQIRFFTIEGDQMVLQPPPQPVAGGQQVSRITWRRVR